MDEGVALFFPRNVFKVTSDNLPLVSKFRLSSFKLLGKPQEERKKGDMVKCG